MLNLSSPPVTDTEVEQMQSPDKRMFIEAPETLLLPPTDPKDSIVCQTVHANTLFSNGFKTENGELTKEVGGYLEQLKASGITHLYTIGVWRASMFSKLIMPYWADKCWSTLPEDRSQIGPSCFSVQSYEPSDKIGDWDNLRTFVDIAKANGIEVVSDFVTNTIALDSEVAIHHPEYIKGEPISTLPEGYRNIEDSKEWAEVELTDGSTTTDWNSERQEHILRIFVNGSQELLVYERTELDENDIELYKYRVYLKQYQDKDSKDRYTDDFAYSTFESDDSHRIYRLSLGRAGCLPKDIWADTLMLDNENPNTISWAESTIRYMEALGLNIRFDMAHLPSSTYWEQLAKRDIHTCQWWAETYSDIPHLTEHMDRVYESWVAKKVRAAQMVELINALRDPNQLQRLLKQGLVFISNHDEGAGFDSLLEIGAAMAVITTCPGAILLAQGSTEGLTVRFSADTNIPMDKFQQMTAEQELKDVYFQEYISKLTRIWNLPVLRDPRSSVIDPTIEVSQNNQVLPLGNPRYDKVYRIARRYKQDSVLAVVNFQPHMIGEKIIIRNIAETYGIDKDTLNQYCFVNLLTGELVPIESNELELLPLSTNEGYFLGHDVYLYAIVHHSVINPPDI